VGADREMSGFISPKSIVERYFLDLITLSTLVDRKPLN